MNLPNKPLGRKAYGSIPHLPGSRRGPGDHGITDGQYRILCEKARDKKDIIILQEKLDGSNVAIAKINSVITPLTRSGYVAWSSPYKQHIFFARWVNDNLIKFDSIVDEGDWISGEWLAQAHGTRYALKHDPLVVFDYWRNGNRIDYKSFCNKVGDSLVIPHLISQGPPVSIEEAISELGPYGFHGALDLVEGAVWRVERDGKIDFLAKYVRHDKEDGKYFPQISGKPEVWNWRPEKEI